MIIVRYKNIGYKRQTACLVVNSIKVNFAYLFDCTTEGCASDILT